MSKISWSVPQQSAINTKKLKNGEGCNILVSAAAGSGKTAVLVERIIRKLIPQNLEDSIPADRLLVVTFTHAAANEMLERIEKSLTQNLAEARKIGDFKRQEHIKRQRLLLATSEITTIDAYCLKLIRKHFNILNLSPAFTIADEAQAVLLADEAMEETFSELYDENDPEFLNLLCIYANNRSDEGLKNLLRQIYDFIMKNPNPFEWLYKKAEELKYENGVENSLWYKKGIENYRLDLQSAKECTLKALEIFGCDDDPEIFLLANPLQDGVKVYDDWKTYYTTFYTSYMYIKELENSDFSKADSILKGFELPRLSGGKAMSAEDKDTLKDYKTQLSKTFANIRNFTSIDIDALKRRSVENLYPVVCSLTHILERFHEKYWNKKLARNILEFSDVEQLSHKLLSENPEISDQLKSAYDEVLMDEYQDTSILQEEIFKYITDGSNLFVVGDMKQSIYRFRSSDPTIFKSRFTAYSAEEESKNRKIILSENFRSRAEVLEGVNDVFRAIMSEIAGELEYDSDQQLNFGNKSYEKTEFDYRPKCVIIQNPELEEKSDDDDTEDFDSVRMEARYVASEIKRLKNEHFMVKSSDTMREIQNRDIVILMSSYKNVANIYVSELLSAGIDCFAEQQGYFERDEIRLMLALFKVISNPYCDIPLLGVMRSPIFSFTDNELVSIRITKKGRFYSAVKEFLNSSNTEDAELVKKAEKFCETIERWRSYSRFMSTDKLIWTIYEESDFYAFAGALRGGDEAQANLRLLYERAKQYESGGFSGLFGFIKYFERIEKKGKDLSSAKLIGENHDVVRIMTIHKSKGLEFPVVFITGGEKRFNLKLDNAKFIMHKDYGISLDYINFEHSYSISSPSKTVFKSVIRAEQLSEEIRKLYVAMTRAKEKLYFVSVIKNLDKLKLVSKSEEKLSPSYVLSATSFASLVIPAIISSENWIIDNVLCENLKPTENIEESAAEQDTFVDIDVKRLLEYEYPFRKSCDLPTKVSASQLKRTQQGSAIITAPTFLSGKRVTGASYGTLIHSVMQHIALQNDMNMDYINAEISRLVNEGILTEQDKKMINPNIIFKFYNSKIGKRLLASDEVHREDTFEISLPAREIYPDIDVSGDENILLQGVIDCWFVENGEIVLLDYKTDSYTNISEIHEKYDKQLELYAIALKKITKKSIKDKNIYLFFSNSMIEY